MQDHTPPGRNDRCPCGSGRKYKHCCLAAARQQTDSGSALSTWHRLRQANEGFPQTMSAFFMETYGPAARDEAWAEFTLWTEEVFDPDSPHMQLFLPWSYHHWSPEPPEHTGVADQALHGRTPTSVFLERRGRRLDPALRRYLEACLDTQLSFHEVLRCEPGRGFRARDVITGAECEVLERSASRSLQSGDILFAQIVAIDGIHMLEGCPSLIIPPIDKIRIVQLRSTISRNPTLDLFPARVPRDYDMELRELYLDLIDALEESRTPELHNTDGDLLAPQRLTWEIDSAEHALQALRHLALEEAGTIAPGLDSRYTFPWLRRGNRKMKEGSNTVLGDIEITPFRLAANVNSNERATRLRRIIVKALGTAARYVGSTPPPDLDPDALPAFQPGKEPPEMRSALNETLAAHYESWPAEPLPALDNRSPQEAVRDADGREKVAALLSQIERDTARMMPSADPDILRRLRARLGL